MPVSPENAHIRAKKAGAARTTPEYHIRSLARAKLTAEQKRQLTALALTLLSADEQPGGAEAGNAA